MNNRNNKKIYQNNGPRTDRFRIGSALGVLLLIGILSSSIYTFNPQKTAASEIAANAIINSASGNTIQGPTPISVTNNDIEQIDYNQVFLEIINKARTDKGYGALIIDRDLNKTAETINDIVDTYLQRSPNISCLKLDERYCGSCFIFQDTSKISSSIAESWVNNPREKHKLVYPYVHMVGLSIKAHDKYVICVCIYYMENIQRQAQNTRYLRLLPIYYESINTIFPYVLIGTNPDVNSEEFKVMDQLFQGYGYEKQLGTLKEHSKDDWYPSEVVHILMNLGASTRNRLFVDLAKNDTLAASRIIAHWPTGVGAPEIYQMFGALLDVDKMSANSVLKALDADLVRKYFADAIKTYFKITPPPIEYSDM